jgi:hypothetical protein
VGEKERDRLITSEPLIIGVVSMGVEGGNSELTLVSGAGVCGLSDFLIICFFWEEGEVVRGR